MDAEAKEKVTALIDRARKRREMSANIFDAAVTMYQEFSAEEVIFELKAVLKAIEDQRQ